jgi:hypothetical protein
MSDVSLFVSILFSPSPCSLSLSYSSSYSLPFSSASYPPTCNLGNITSSTKESRTSTFFLLLPCHCVIIERTPPTSVICSSTIPHGKLLLNSESGHHESYVVDCPCRHLEMILLKFKALATLPSEVLCGF